MTILPPHYENDRDAIVALIVLLLPALLAAWNAYQLHKVTKRIPERRHHQTAIHPLRRAEDNKDTE